MWASQANCRALHDAEANSVFHRHDQWMVRHGRTYKDNAEKEKRFKIFKDNMELIESFNRGGNQPYNLRINEFADQTNEEFLASRNGYKFQFPNLMSSPSEQTSFRYENVTAIPSSMDWRENGAVTPIKDQGECGKPKLLAPTYPDYSLDMYICKIINAYSLVCYVIRKSIIFCRLHLNMLSP